MRIRPLAAFLERFTGACLAAPGSSRDATEARSYLRPSGNDPSRVILSFTTWASASFNGAWIVAKGIEGISEDSLSIPGAIVCEVTDVGCGETEILLVVKQGCELDEAECRRAIERLSGIHAHADDLERILGGE